MIDLAAYESFLLLLGSFFVPLFGVLLADWLAARRATTAQQDIFGAPAFRSGAARRVVRRLRALPVAAPARPLLVDRSRSPHTNPPDLAVGSTIPSFAVSLALAAGAGAAGRRWRAAESTA